MIIRTKQNNKCHATASQEENRVDVAVGNIENRSRIPGVILEYGVRSINGRTGDVVIDTTTLVGAVSYMVEQELTEEEKQRARTNIGVDTAIPTKTSELENDSGFITEADVPVKSVNGQVGDVSLTYSDVGALPSDTFIPSKTSDLENDSDYITSADIPTDISAFNNDVGYLTSINSTDVVNALSYTPYNASNPDGFITSADIPTNISAFNNDSGYITGINSSDVTTALGYTPYNSTNPNGYVNSAQAASAAPVQSVNGQTGTVTGLQIVGNLVTSVSAQSTDSQYPSAKLFYDTVGNIETLLASI